MFHGFYATTKDRKGGIHNYKLRQGETVPQGHEITDLSVASRFKLSEMLSPESLDLLNAVAGKEPPRKLHKWSDVKAKAKNAKA